MIFQLIKRDPAWRGLPYLTLAFAAVCALWHFFAPADRSGMPALFISEIFIAPTIFAVTTAFLQSLDTPLQASLPVTVRQVFLSRMLSMLAVLWLPVLAGLATLTVLKDPIASDLPLDLWSVVTCVVLGMQCLAVRGITLRAWMIFLAATTGMFSDAISPFFSGSPAWTEMLALGFCWVIGVALVLRTWQVVPNSFQLAPPKNVSVTLPAGSVTSAPSWKTPLRIVVRTRGLESLVPFAVILLYVSNPLWYIFLGFQWPGIRQRIRWILPLPIPPRILLAIVMLPTLVGLCAGYEVHLHLPWTPLPGFRGLAVRRAQDVSALQHRLSEDPECRTLNVFPSMEYWIPVHENEAPLLQAPWGETFRPPISRVAGFAVYNPYAVGCGNSRRFLEWQFNRATTAIFGRPIALDQKVNPYVEQTAISTPRTQFVTLGCLVAFSLLSLLIAMLFDWHRLRALARWLWITLASLAGLLAAGLLLWSSFFDQDPIQLISWTLPASLPLTVATIAMTTALLYLAVERLFRQLEFTGKAQPPR